MIDDIGVDTRDLRILGIPNPTERGLDSEELEDAIQRHGRRCRRWGVGILVGSWFATFIAAISTESGLFADSVARLFAVLGFVGLSILGGVILSAGLTERRDRHQRALTRVAIRQGQENRTQLKAIMGIVSPITRQLAALEAVIDKVPAYGEGVILGAQLRADAIGLERN